MGEKIQDLLIEDKMSIIISLPYNRADFAKAAIDAGADGLKFHINVEHRASGNVFKDLDNYVDTIDKVKEMFDGPLGIVAGDDISKVNQTNPSVLKNTGFSYFSLYSKDIPSKMMLENDLYKTVALDDQYDPQKCTALKLLGFDALELSVVKKEDYGKPLHVDDLAKYAYYRQLSDLPLIVPSQKKLVKEDLAMLRRIGVNAVMLGAVTIGNTIESISSTIAEFVDYNNHLG